MTDELKTAIAAELYRAFERLGADSELLGPIGSWGEGIYGDDWLLEQLRRINDGYPKNANLV